jgi:hypothetical protein
VHRPDEIRFLGLEDVVHVALRIAVEEGA